MKAFMFSTKFLWTLLITLPLNLCSSDDGGEDNTFEPITITFEENFETDCGEVWIVDNVNLSISPFTEDEIDPNGLNSDLIGQCPFFEFFSGNNGSVALGLAQAVLEIDFSSIEGFSKITITVADNAGQTQANLFL